MLFSSTAAAALFLASAVSTSVVPTGRQQQHQEVLTQMPEGYRVIEFAPYQQRLMTEEEIMKLIENDTPFMDVTDYPDLGVPSLVQSLTPEPKLPNTPRVPDMVKPHFEQFSTEYMKQFLTNFSSFQNRYYDTYGAQSAQFLFDLLSDLASKSNHKVTVSKFMHKYAQFSIIARFEGINPSADTVIVGAHQDSINARNPREGRAPGADDDGSGATTILEVFRVLCQSETFKPYRPVEFHWYSAEEVGLWGSQAVASEYKKSGRKVYAMIQNDMTGYVDEKTRRDGVKHFGLVTDFVNPELTNFIEALMNKYSDMPVKRTRCNYGCSDHASWFKAGYRSAFPFEGEFREMSPFVHTEKDSIETVDFEHMLEYAKLSLAFAVELSQP